MSRPRRLTRAIALSALSMLTAIAGWPAAALAHGDYLPPGTPVNSLWQFPPEIIGGLLLAGCVYLRGLIAGGHVSGWRIAAFFGGLGALAIALISPVEELADHIFAVHQVEHMLLRTTGPFLLFLSAPQRILMRGLPASWRRRLLRPAASAGWIRRLLHGLRRPPVAALLFLASSYFWMIPRYHDQAILNEPIHYCWHISLLLSGLLFFSVLLDPRAEPVGASLAARMGMFLAAALGNIVLGAFLTFKSVPIYSAYLTLGHLWHVSMLTDEQTGGIVMWIPGTMMFAITAMIVLYRWGQEEQRRVERRAREGRALIQSARRSNGALAFGLGSAAMLMVLVAFSVVALIDHAHSAVRDFGAAGHIPG